VKVEGRETRVTLQSVKSKPKRVVIDPNGWWLVQAEVRQGK